MLNYARRPRRGRAISQKLGPVGELKTEFRFYRPVEKRNESDSGPILRHFFYFISNSFFLVMSLLHE